MMRLAAAQAPHLALSDLRRRGWRFVEMLRPMSMLDGIDMGGIMGNGRWLAIPPDHLAERAAQFPSRAAAMRSASSIETAACHNASKQQLVKDMAE